LRFVFQVRQSRGEYAKWIARLDEFVDTSWFWFKTPIVSTPSSLEEMGYHAGSCKTGEQIGKMIINMPVNVLESSWNVLLDKFEQTLQVSTRE